MPVQDLDEVLPDYDAMLSNSSYSKMWQEMSAGDRKLCVTIAELLTLRKEEESCSLCLDLPCLCRIWCVYMEYNLNQGSRPAALIEVLTVIILRC